MRRYKTYIPYLKTTKRVLETPTSDLSNERAGNYVDTDTIVLDPVVEKPTSVKKIGKDPGLEMVELGSAVRATVSTPVPIEIARVALPTGIVTWMNLFFAFRLKSASGKIGPIKLSLRKYQLIRGEWKRRQVFNINSYEEAKIIYDLIRTYFPEVVK